MLQILNDFGVQLENIKQTLNNYNTVISLREKLGDLHRELAWVKVLLEKRVLILKFYVAFNRLEVWKRSAGKKKLFGQKYKRLT